jgi:energy-coupling factor transporter ATP-binding protein EcfA2
MVIVEGPDGSGKSTLVQWLHEQLKDSKVVRWNDPPENEKQLGQNLMCSGIMMKYGDNVIQDRSPWVTDPIYKTVEIGSKNMGTWAHYQAKLIEIQPVLIYCRPPDSVITRHAKTGSSPPDNPKYLSWIGNNIEKLIFFYDQFFGSLRPLVYDWTKSEGILKAAFVQRITTERRRCVDRKYKIG